MRKKYFCNIVLFALMFMACFAAAGVFESYAATMCQHDDKKKVIVRTANCKQAGLTEYRCSKCNQLMHSSTTPKISIHGSTHMEKSDASCTVNGWTKVICDVCNSVLSNTVITATGHKYADQYWASAPNCTLAGGMVQKCSVCGDTRTDARSAYGHDYSVYIGEVDRSCTSDGYLEYKCSRCSSREYKNLEKAFGHSYETVTVSATCYSEGSVTDVCKRCSDTIVKSTTPKLAHKYNESVYSTVTAPTCTKEGTGCCYCQYGCNNYKVVSINKLGHFLKETKHEATCVKDGYIEQICQRSGCSYKKTTKTDSALGHLYDETQYTVVKAPTTEAAGIGYSYCLRKDCSSYKQVTIPRVKENTDKNDTDDKKNCTHTGTVKTEKEDSTCYKKGFVRQYCTYCNAELSYTTIDKKDHVWDKSKGVKVSDSTGYAVYEYPCVNSPKCTAKTTETIKIEYPDDKDDDKNKESSEELCKKLGHEWNGQSKDIVDSTCYKEGYWRYICSRCGKAFGEKYIIEKKAHNFDFNNGKLISSSAGFEVYQYKCTNPGCKETYQKEIHTKFEPEKDDPCVNGHISNSSSKITVPATCKEEGYWVLTCSRCGIELGNRTVIPKKEHVWDEGTLSQTGSGYNTYVYTCINCGETYSDTKSTMYDIKEEQDPGKPQINKCPDGKHNWSEWDEKTIATCQHGSFSIRTCLIPGCGTVETSTSPIGSHQYKEIDVPSTCIKLGYTCKECCFCQKQINIKKKKKLAKHDYSDWSTDQVESCYQVGYYHRQCSYCKKYDYKQVAVLKHVPKHELKIINASGKNSAGLASMVCKYCDAMMGDKIVLPAVAKKITGWTIEAIVSSGVLEKIGAEAVGEVLKIVATNSLGEPVAQFLVSTGVPYEIAVEAVKDTGIVIINSTKTLVKYGLEIVDKGLRIVEREIEKPLEEVKNNSDEKKKKQQNAKIIYNSNGGSGNMQPTTVNSLGKLVVMPNQFSAPKGYVFDSWNTKANGKGKKVKVGKSYSNRTEDLELYAKWKPIKYTVSFDLACEVESGNEINPIQFTYSDEANVSLPIPERKYYKFNSWSGIGSSGKIYIKAEDCSPNKIHALSSVNGEKITLTASWTLEDDAYEIVFRTDLIPPNVKLISGKAQAQTYPGKIGDVITPYNLPESENYRIVGWDLVNINSNNNMNLTWEDCPISCKPAGAEPDYIGISDVKQYKVMKDHIKNGKIVLYPVWEDKRTYDYSGAYYVKQSFYYTIGSAGGLGSSGDYGIDDTTMNSYNSGIFNSVTCIQGGIIVLDKDGYLILDNKVSGFNVVSSGYFHCLEKFTSTTNYKPENLGFLTTSGIWLKTSPGRTTTVLGRFTYDTENILKQLNLLKSNSLDGNIDGFNVLDVTEEYANLPDDVFWETINKPFLDAAVARKDVIILATDERYFIKEDGTESIYYREYKYLTDSVEDGGLGLTVEEYTVVYP